MPETGDNRQKVNLKLQNMKKSFTIIILLLVFWSYADAQKLFTLLSQKKTGIDFVNKVKDDKEKSILIYANYYGGAGVGVGDFNNDGLQDIYFAGNLSGDELFLNEGNLSFKNITKKAGIKDNGGWSSGVVIADVNQDGLADIYVTRELYDDSPELRKNKLYINNGDLTFTESAEKYGIEDDERTRHATFFDYDKDGDLDLFVLNQPPNPGNYSKLNGVELLKEEYSPRLYRNNGPDQKFTDVTVEAGLLKPGFPNSVVTCDLNKDGWMDIYVANDFQAPDFLYMNNADGTFTEIVKDAMGHISFYSMGVDAADINNDSWPDLMVVDMVAEDNFRLKANMSGMDPSKFWKVVSDGGHYQYMYNTLQINQGNNRYSDIGQMTGISSTDWSWSNLIADFDNDGLKDIYVTNGLLRDIRNSDAEKAFPKYVTQKINEYIMAHPNDPNVTKLDVIDIDEGLSLLPSVKLSNYAYKNKGNLEFEKVMDEWGLDEKTFSNGACYADLDNDGDLDLIINNVNERAYIYQNNAETKTANNYLRVKVKDGKNQFLFGTKAEIEIEGEKQYIEFTNVRGIYSTSENVAHFGIGENKKVDRLRIYWTDGSITEKHNIKANQLLEFDKAEEKTKQYKEEAPEAIYQNLTADASIDFVHQENDFDDFEKQVLLPHKMSQFGPALAVGDVNGDGLDDFYVGGAANQPGKVYTQSAEGTFSANDIMPLYDKACEDISALFFDADGDGDMDLYVASGGNEHEEGHALYQDRLYLNDGKGNFKRNSKSLPKLVISSGKVIAHDYDKDGDLDLFVSGRHKPHSYPEPVSSYLLENNGGIFTDVTEAKAPGLINIGMVTDAVWMDIEHDGSSELILAGEWMSLQVFKETAGKFENQTETYGLSNSTGWWYSLEKADLDNDGYEDLIAGNLGLNYKYKTSPTEPFDVHYYDFDSNGSKDIVLGYYNGGNHFPLRGRSCSSQQVPEIKKKFTSYNLFAAAELEEVYGENKLDHALHYEAQTFASTIFKNENGKFTPIKLPIEAQISTINDFIFDDVDKDGLLDIILAGNLYVAEVETPRSDAGIGLLLKNKGDLNFEAVNVLESGVFLPYDVKQLELIKLGTEKSPAFLVGVNDGPLQLLKRKINENSSGR